MVEAHYRKHGAAATAAAAEPAGSAEQATTEAQTAADMGLEPSAAAAGEAGGAGLAPTAFVCQNFTCQAPTGDAGRVYELLSKQQGAVGAVKLQPVKL